MTSSSSSPPSSPPRQRSILIVIDLEFSGGNSKQNFIISLGSIVADSSSFEILSQKFIPFKKPENKEWDVDTRKWWEEQARREPAMAQELKRIDDGLEGYSPHEGISQFVLWVMEMTTQYCREDGDLVTFSANTCSVDFLLINEYLQESGYPPLHQFFGKYKDVFDFTSFGLGLIGMSRGELDRLTKQKRGNKTKLIRQYLQIPDSEQPSSRYTHNPVDDCLNELEEYSIWLKYYKLRFGDYRYGIAPKCSWMNRQEEGLQFTNGKRVRFQKEVKESEVVVVHSSI